MSENVARTRLPSSDDGVAAPVRSALPGDHDLTRGIVESVSHHLRTPLCVVLGHAELLINHEDELSAGAHQSLATLVRAARRLDDVTRGVCDLVAIACVEPMTADPVDITELVAAEVAAYQDRAAQRDVRLLISGEQVQECMTDARRLRRALRELLDNAVTYAPDESTVRVATTTVATGIRIEVRDHGDGIAASDRERLVRPFERGTNPRQPATGRGMGLALASVVAASLGGRLVLSESTGPGLRACLEIPADATHRHRAAVTGTPASS